MTSASPENPLILLSEAKSMAFRAAWRAWHDGYLSGWSDCKTGSRDDTPFPYSRETDADGLPLKKDAN